MIQQLSLHDLSIASVKEACENYLLKKDLSLFVNRTNMEYVPLIGLSTPDWDEEFQIESEHYQGYEQSADQCMVLARIALKDKRTPSSDSFLVDATVLCTLKGEKIEYASVHMTNPKRKAFLYDPIHTKEKETDQHFKNALYQAGLPLRPVSGRVDRLHRILPGKLQPGLFGRP